MLLIENIFSFFGFSNARANGAVLEAPRRAAAPPLAGKRAALRAEIAGYANLTADDFDGDGGHAPAQKDIDNAISFIPHIPDEGIETARVMCGADSDVTFDWKHCCLEIGFVEGEISFFGDMPDGEKLGGDEVYSEDAIPADLQKLMLALFPAH